MGKVTDQPKMLANPAAKAQRLEQLNEPHIRTLTAFAKKLRSEMGPDFKIPDFDPWDGGVNAKILYLLEAPGPKAISSGFISRNNPDETAKNFFLLNQEAKIPRKLTITWNIVPWYIGSMARIRAATKSDITAGIKPLERLLDLLPRLGAVVLLGKKAQCAESLIGTLQPELKIFKSPHPSPVFVNRARGNRERILAVLREVRDSTGGLGQA